MDKSCLNPWMYINIEGNGFCYFCCSIYTKDKYYIGNILEQSIDEIWNGQRAQEFRRDIIENKYTHCNLNKCQGVYNKLIEFCNDRSITTNLTAPYPQYIQLSYDYSCSQKCIFCRDEIRYFNKNEEEKWNSIIDTKIIPFFKNAKILSICGLGEIFDSKHSKLLLQKILDKYPTIQTEIYSNGIKFNEKNIKELNLTNNIRIAHLSIHAADKETYKKIWRADNFDKVMKNLEYTAELKRTGNIKEFILSFVINKENYKNMKKFLQLGQRLGALVSFTLAHSSGTTYTNDVKEYAVWDKRHYLYNDFVKQLQDPIFLNQNCCLDFEYKTLKPISRIQIIKNYINTKFSK